MRVVPLNSLLMTVVLTLAAVCLLSLVPGAKSQDLGEQVLRLQADAGDHQDLFGSAVALSRDGRVLAVGANLEASGRVGEAGDNSMPGAGAVYVYELGERGWQQTAYLKAPVPSPGAGFGFSLALAEDGRTLVAGAPFEQLHAASGEGATYVFERAKAGQWTLQAGLFPAAGVVRQGIDVALSRDGKTLAAAGTGAQGAPLAQVHALRGARWEADGLLEMPGPSGDAGLARLAMDAQGSRVALSHAGTGRLLVFDRTPGGWSAQAALSWARDTEASASGAVALCAEGDRLAVSLQRGRIAVLQHTGAAWQLQAQLQAPEGGDEGFAQRVVMSPDGARVLTAAAGSSSVYAFQREGGGWSAQPPIGTGLSAAALLGSALALSVDGRSLAVGARWARAAQRPIDRLLPLRPRGDVGAVQLVRVG